MSLFCVCEEKCELVSVDVKVFRCVSFVLFVKINPNDELLTMGFLFSKKLSLTFSQSKRSIHGQNKYYCTLVSCEVSELNNTK